MRYWRSNGESIVGISASKLVTHLYDNRGDLSRTGIQNRIRALKTLSSLRLRDPELLTRYHDTLLFFLAYPSHISLVHRCTAELKRVTAILNTSVTLSESLLGSGIAGSARIDSFGPELSLWLAKESHAKAEISWDEGTDDLDDFLRKELLGSLGDAVLEQDLSTKSLLQRLRRPPARSAALGHRSATSSLQWLVEEFLSLPGRPVSKDRIWSSLNIWVRWQCAKLSRTWIRFPARALVFAEGNIRTPFDLKSTVRAPIKHIRPLSRVKAEALIGIARGTLASRGRETDPVTSANPHDVFLLSLDKGIDVAIFGLSRERRLPLETYLGFVAAKNAIPCAYGGAWLLGERAEIGVNIFDEFRGGDSAFLFAQIMRVYTQAFGARLFTVHESQFGDDNEEALMSGAFWFYDRLGFRHEDHRLRDLADRERKRRVDSPGHRSSRRTLKSLSSKRLCLSLTDIPPLDLDVGQIGAAALSRGRGPLYSSDISTLFSPLTRLPPRLVQEVALCKNGLRESAFPLFLQRHPEVLQALSRRR